jgi:xanthine dehydrogenase accessory factor
MAGIYEKIDEHLSRGRKGILATIIKGKGPTPQKEGAKIFIDEAGSITGSIGGGCVEAQAWKEARDLAGGEETRIIRYLMTSNEVAEEGMVCGGVVDIFLEPVLERHREMYMELLKRLNGSSSCTMVTRIGSPSSKSLVTAEGKVWGDPLDEAILEQLSEKSGEKDLYFLGDWLVEPFIMRNRLYVYGAGHISLFISKIAKMIDFEVTVIDDRASFASRERFPEADRVVPGYFTDFIRTNHFTGADFHVIVTRGHRHDADVLEEVLKVPGAYVGMIGSDRKIRLVYEHLKMKGTDPALFERVRAPIGIDLEAVTPQEIAVSIAGELINERARFDR